VTLMARVPNGCPGPATTRAFSLAGCCCTGAAGGRLSCGERFTMGTTTPGPAATPESGTSSRGGTCAARAAAAGTGDAACWAIAAAACSGDARRRRLRRASGVSARMAAGSRDEAADRAGGTAEAGTCAGDLDARPSRDKGDKARVATSATESRAGCLGGGIPATRDNASGPLRCVEF
jgi:hypothetical protein